MIIENNVTKEQVRGITEEGWQTLKDLNMARYWHIVTRDETKVSPKKIMPKALIDFTNNKPTPKKKQIKEKQPKK